HALPLREAEPAAELLQKYRHALCWAQQQDRIDLRDVDAFVEYVDREDHVDPAGPQIGDRGTARLSARIAEHGSSRHPRGIEPLGHETRVLHAGTEAERSYPGKIDDLLPQRLQHLRHPSVVAVVDVL